MEAALTMRKYTVTEFLILYLLLIFFFKRQFLDKAMTLTTVADYAMYCGIVTQERNVTTDREINSNKFVTQSKEAQFNSVRNDAPNISKYTVNSEKTDSAIKLDEHSSYLDEVGPAGRLEEYSLQFVPAESTGKLEEHMFQLERADSTEILGKPSTRGRVDAPENQRGHTHELDEETSEEDLGDLYIEQMLQKHEMAASGMDEAFDVDEAITNLSSGAFEVSQLTDSGNAMTQMTQNLEQGIDETDEPEYQASRTSDGKITKSS